MHYREIIPLPYVIKVEGAKTNTSKRLPITNTLLPGSAPQGVGMVWPHGVTDLGATSAPPPCRVGNGLHSISGWFKVGLGWLVNAYSSDSIHCRGGGSSHSIHKVAEVGPQSTKGVGT